MTRGTFANIRLQNAMTPHSSGGWTRVCPGGRASDHLHDQTLPSAKIMTVICAGLEYGTGSSRDLSRNRTTLLGVRAVIAQSFERIHRSNLISVKVLPLQWLEANPTIISL